MAAIICPGELHFNTISDAPANSACCWHRESRKVVSINTNVNGARFLTWRMASRPFMAGICKSSKIASGGYSCSRAASKEDAEEKQREQYKRGSHCCNVARNPR